MPKIHNFPTGDYSVFFMEDFLSNKDLSDEIIGQSPVGNIVNLRYKLCRHRLYTGYKGCRIIGVSGFRHKRRTRPFSFYEECAQLINKQRKSSPHSNPNIWSCLKCSHFDHDCNPTNEIGMKGNSNFSTLKQISRNPLF